MSASTRKRSERINTLRTRISTGIEALESRQLLTLPTGSYHPYAVAERAARVVDGSTPNIAIAHPIGSQPARLATLGNQGKIVSGADRAGDNWTITVHGPGQVVVSDITPNDGVLNDELDTIQIIGADPNNTYVTGQTTSSNRVFTDGTIQFNHLYSLNGVKSIILNGFTLAQTVTPNVSDDGTLASLPNDGTEIYLPGGVGYLQFHNIDAPIDTATNTQAMDIIIGRIDSPLPYAPTIRLDSIFNTVYDSSATTFDNGTPRTTPTVRILVNGAIKDLSFISTGQAPIPAAYQYQFPIVGTTGRTAVRAVSMRNLKVVGSARNFTVSKGEQPFANATSGVTRVHSAKFGGVTDAVAIDSQGKIGKLRFQKGLGDPAGSQTGAIYYGLPDSQRGYGSFGLLGGAIRARRIGSITAGPAGTIQQTSNNPNELMAGRQGQTTYYQRPGVALQSATIASAKSIGQVHIVGNQQNSEIKSGFYYPAYVQGLEGTRARSRIARIKQRGDNVDAVTSATYRPGVNNTYGAAGSVAGPGTLRGHFLGHLYTAGGQTSLGNYGVGFYARRKLGNLPQGA
jgi:hypothetical protein